MDKCARGRNPHDAFPFFALQVMAGTRQVIIVGDSKARAGIKKVTVENAVRLWAKTCKNESQGGGHIPNFVVDWEHDRTFLQDTEDRIYRTTILIVFSEDEAAPYESQTGHTEVAEWLPIDNSIKMFGRCGRRYDDMPCEKVRNLIDWESNWGEMVIAHEIGHALGLSHDSSKCKVQGLMQAILRKDVILPILPDYCKLVDDINNDKAPCNSVDTSISDENPCN